MRLNGNCEPIGYFYDHLSFSWDTLGLPEEQIVHQQVIIAEDSSFNQLLQTIEATTNIVSIPPKFLNPRTRYFWKVICSTKTTQIEAISFFETGKMTEVWIGDWLSYTESPLDSVRFHKDFILTKKVKKARLYCCGYGLYEAEINGEKITEEVLLPGYHSYDLLNQYQTYDVTSLLAEKNELSFLTGNGWYKGRFVFEGGYENIYGEKQQIIAELLVEFEDGSTEIIKSDDTWQVETTKIKENSIYDGEIVDFTAKSTSLRLKVLKDGKTLLSERSNPAILKQDVLLPQQIFYDDNKKMIVDFGQIITGWIEGWVDAQTVCFRFSELLQNNCFYRDNLRTAKQTFSAKVNGREYLRPHFTFFSFRYVEIEGISMEQARELKAYTIHSEMEELFHFDSSNPKLNKLVENIKWSQKDNFLDIPTDCPQRDERMGWTGDVSIFANASCYNYQTKSFYENYLRNLALEQNDLSGSVPFFVPFPKIVPHEGINPFLVTNGAAVWADVATILPYQLFRHYKDLGLLKQSIKVMKNWVDYIHQRDIENGNKHLWDFDRQLGDWLALDNGNPNNPIGATDPTLIASIYYYQSVNFLAKSLDVLKSPKTPEYRALAEEIRQAILKKYYQEETLNLEKQTQTAISLLLHHGLFPNDAAKGELKKILVKRLAENGNYLNTGFVGTPVLTHALAENGLTEEAYTLLFNEAYPSWFYEVNLGATTIWERWNSLLPDGIISGTEMNSLNHYAYGAVQDFIIEKIIGIRHIFEQKEINTMQLQPTFNSRLKWVKGSLKTPNGLLVVSWRWLDEKTVELEADVPHDFQLIYNQVNGKETILNSGKTVMNIDVSMELS